MIMLKELPLIPINFACIVVMMLEEPGYIID